MMPRTRPSMHARDSSGRQVSLLNDEPASRRDTPLRPRRADREVAEDVSESSLPPTPGLSRSDSYDSRASNDPQSPMTPTGAEFADPRSYSVDGYGGYVQDSLVPYDDERTSGGNAAATSGGKRYPCRFKESQGCDKSFTTSGHASRHSKIHTAEKAVPCIYQGCYKKFTRNDNMKQHYETHFKDRSGRHAASTASRLTVAAGVKKPSAGARVNRPSSRAGWTGPLTINTRATFTQYPPEVLSGVSSYSAPSPSASPRSSYGALDMDDFQSALPAPESDGLNALVAAVDSQIDQID